MSGAKWLWIFFSILVLCNLSIAAQSEENTEFKGFFEAQLGLQHLRLYDELNSNLNYSGFAIPVGLNHFSLNEHKNVVFTFQYLNTELSNNINDSSIKGYSGLFEFQYKSRIHGFSILDSRLYVGGYTRVKGFKRIQNSLIFEAFSTNEVFASAGPSIGIVKDISKTQFIIIGINHPFVSYLDDLDTKASPAKGWLFLNKLNDFKFNFKYVFRSNEDMYLSFNYIFEYYHAHRKLYDVHYGSHTLLLGFLIKLASL